MVGVERSKPEPDNVSNGTSHGAEVPTNADVSLGENNRWLRSVVENSSEIVTVVDPDGTLRYASPAFGRVLGYDPDEAVGTMNVLDYVHLEDLPHVLEETEEALSKGASPRTRLSIASATETACGGGWRAWEPTSSTTHRSVA
jgi:PAS domain-containing protein